MRLSVNVPCTGELLLDPGLTVIARAAEAAGADSLWVSDHLVSVDSDTLAYPYSDDGRPPWTADTNIFESLTCCSFLLAATTTCRVGTGVLVLPQRNLLEFAKVTASIDQLGGGRLDLGVGAGWDDREFAALGYDFATRGARFDEMLRLLPGCYSGQPAKFDGGHTIVGDAVNLYPLPAQPGGPPLLVGGTNRRALRRAAQLGAGWFGLAFVRSLDLQSLRASVATLHEMRQAQGREGPFPLFLKLHAYNSAEFEQLSDIAPEIERIGFHELVIDVPWTSSVDAALKTFTRVQAVLHGARKDPS
jgi:probable F420-dependent oxidoreductase